MVIAITGAAGNLGSFLSQHLLAHTPHELRLLIHKHDLPDGLRNQARAPAFRCDLAKKETLTAALHGVDCVIHFAGVLFKARPERFLPTTNTAYFKTLLAASVEQKVHRVILISFPHVEGETSPEFPAIGKLDASPKSVHAKTRLEEEKLLFAQEKVHPFEAVSLRVGMVYGRGILMIDAARWLTKRGLLGIWREPTSIHLISTEDFLEATSAAATQLNIHGIYHLGDEGRQTLQEFLDAACQAWQVRKPWRLPLGLLYFASWLCEFQSWLLGTKAPLTRDFLTIGRCSYYGDTTRMRTELVSQLKYTSFKEGVVTL